MRTKKIENDQMKLKKMALEKGKKGDKNGAMMALRRSKMQEKELQKLQGQMITLEQ